MSIIYHLVSRADWEQLPEGPYRAPSLETEGFIHCSREEQVPVIADLFYRDVPDLLVLHIDASSLGDSLRYERAAIPPEFTDVAGLQAPFPHVYGPIPREAILRITEHRNSPLQP